MKKLFNDISLLTLMLFAVMTGTRTLASTPAFPGAEGGGMYTTGGRKGTVYYVNTLSDGDAGNSTTREGSLRWCVGRSGARTILFKVSGLITLTKRLNISNGNVTIAGQTAPGDGICLRGYDVTVSADNVIIRYMRFRLGDINGDESDCIWGRYHKNIMLDHCSMSWSVDECASFYCNYNFTMQWCLLAESLRYSVHVKGAHGYCGLWGGKNATFHHNLMAHHDNRNPRYNGWKRSGLGYTNPWDEERMDFRNNVIYNYGSNGGYGGEAAGKYNVVNNYYKPGPATSSSARNRFLQIDIDTSKIYLPRHGKFYVTGNLVIGNSAINQNNTKGMLNNTGLSLDSCLVSTPYYCYPITQHTADKAFEKVLAYAGASLKRDTVDARIVKEALNGTYTYTGSNGSKNGLIDSQADVGGWPAYNSGTAPADTDIDGIPDGWLDDNYGGKTANDTTEAGYTYLEVYLNSLVNGITTKQNQDGVMSAVKDPKAIARGHMVVFYDPALNRLWIEAPKAAREVCLYSLDGRLIKRNLVNLQQSISINCDYLCEGIVLSRLTYMDGSADVAKVMIMPK